MKISGIQSEFTFAFEQSFTKKYGKFYVNFNIIEESTMENSKKEKMEISLSSLVNITHQSSEHVLCFDLSDKSSFEKMDNWIIHLRERYPTIKPIILVGVCSSDNFKRFETLDFFENYSKERKLISYFEINTQCVGSLQVVFEFISRIEIEKKVKSIIAMRKLSRYSNDGE
jgi:GTPase SAR1 family protein